MPPPAPRTLERGQSGPAPGGPRRPGTVTGGAHRWGSRTRSWFCDEVYAALAGRGVALCIADTEEATTPCVATAAFGYLRLRRASYGEAELEAWRQRLVVQPWREAFVYFKHEDEARGPAFALELTALLARSTAGD